MPTLGLETPYFVRHRWRPWTDKHGHQQIEHEVSFMRDPDEQAALEPTMRERVSRVIEGSEMTMPTLDDVCAKVPEDWSIDVGYEGDGFSTLFVVNPEQADVYRAFVGKGHAGCHGEGWGPTRAIAIERALARTQEMIETRRGDFGDITGLLIEAGLIKA